MSVGDMEQTEQVPEICLIAPSEHLADLTRRVASERGIQVGIYVAVLDEGLKLARTLSRQGARIFVSRKGTAELLAQNHFTVASSGFVKGPSGEDGDCGVCGVSKRTQTSLPISGS